MFIDITVIGEVEQGKGCVVRGTAGRRVILVTGYPESVCCGSCSFPAART